MHYDVKKIPRPCPPSTQPTPNAYTCRLRRLRARISKRAAIARLCRYSLNNCASRLSPYSPYDFSLLRPRLICHHFTHNPPRRPHYPAPKSRKFPKNSGVFIPKSRRLAHFLFAKNFLRASPTTQLSEFQQNKKNKKFFNFLLDQKIKIYCFGSHYEKHGNPV